MRGGPQTAEIFFLHIARGSTFPVHVLASSTSKVGGIRAHYPKKSTRNCFSKTCVLKTPMRFTVCFSYGGSCVVGGINTHAACSPQAKFFLQNSSSSYKYCQTKSFSSSCIFVAASPALTSWCGLGVTQVSLPRHDAWDAATAEPGAERGPSLHRPVRHAE